MPLTQLAPPYPIFTDKNGDPLDAGYLYFGVVNQNPETNPIQVYYDSAFTQPAAQPLRTSNGYVMRNGSPALLFAGSQFSVTVRNKNNELVIYSPVGYGVDPASISGTVIYDDFTGDGVATVFTLTASPSTKNATNVYIDGIYQSKDNYNTVGSTLTFSTAPPLNSAIEVVTQESSIIGGASSQQITYNQGGSGAITRTVQSRLRDFVSVKDFGAVGDGVTDDTVAIQNAIDYVYGTGTYGTVVIPPSSGEYIFTQIVNKSKVILKGTGGVLKLKDNTCVDSGTNYYPVGNASSLDVSVTYDGLIIDGNKANNTLFNVADGITCVGKYSSVINCKVTNPPDSGIMFSNAAFGICSGNEVSGATDAGIYSNGDEGTENTEGMIITNNRIENCVYPGIAVKRSGIDYIVTNNTIVNCGNGITLTDFGVGTGGHPNNILIANNYLKDIGYPYRSASPAPSEVGITAQICDNVTISNNILKNVSGVGIHIDGSRKCCVTNNIVIGYAASPHSGTYGNTGLLAIARSGQTPIDCVISSNLIRDVDGEGIYLRDIQYSSITNNIVKGAGEYGLRLFDGADNNILMGNVVEGTTGDLLYSSALATNNAYGLNITPDLVGTAINGIRRDNVNTTPVSNVTPRYAGEFYYVTTGSKLFFAVGSTDTDWIALN